MSNETKILSALRRRLTRDLSPTEREWTEKRVGELEADVDPGPTDSSPAPTLRWHVCSICELAGWAREGFYCRLHSERPEAPFVALEDRDESGPTAPDGRPLTMIEIVLGRQILKAPLSLHDRIRSSGGYAKITPEDWAEYDEAMAQWREETRKLSS